MSNKQGPVKQLLLSSSYWTLSKPLVYKFGLEAAFLLCNFAEAENLSSDGWFYQTIETVQEKTTLSRRKQDNAIESLEKLGVLYSDVRGIPAKRYFKIDYEKISTILFEQNVQTSLSETDKLECAKRTTNKELSNKELSNKEFNNKAGIKFPSNSSQFILANQFREILLKYKSDSKVPANTEQGLQTWSQDIDYMMRLDKRDPKKILELIDWAQRDNFWCSNIRSPRKLRDKWDTLELQKNKANANGAKERVRTVENVQNEWEDFINGNF